MDSRDQIFFIEEFRRFRNSFKSFWTSLKYGLRKNKIVYTTANSMYIHKTAIVDLCGNLYLSRNMRGVNDAKSILILQKDAKLITKGNFSFGYGADIRLFDGAKLELGEDSYVNNNCLIRCAKDIRIGNDCAISYNCTIMDSDSHSIVYDEDEINNHIGTSPVVIGNHVWIGANVTILKGVNIGNNVVVGAGSVVRSNIPDNSLAVGNPAVVVKKICDWQ